MVDFEYVRPRSVAEAARLLASDADARALAGGQTLIPAMKQRLLRPTLLVDLQDLAEMKGISVSASEVVVGAMTPHAQTASHAGIRAAIPALSDLASGIAHPQVRQMGTMGGSIANNDPAADYPAALLGLGATIETNTRSIAADDFFTGLFGTALAAGELVLRIRFPRPKRAGYCKIANPASGYVTTGCFVAQTDGGVRVAVNGAGPCVFRQHDFERVLGECFEAVALHGIRQDPAGLNSDIHASAAYRASLVPVAVRRALRRAADHTSRNEK